MSKKIPLFSLVILIIAAIDNLKNLPAIAMMGSDLLALFILAAFIFLLPTALVSAELSASYPTEGGIYRWVSRAFGKKWGMLAIWLQWINTMVWYPTMLAFLASSLAYIFHPAWAHNKLYLVSTSLALFWLLTLVNLKGMRLSTLVNNVLALIGVGIPLLTLLVLGLLWVVKGHPVEVKFDRVLPDLSHTTSWVSLIAIVASFLGMELSSVHVNEIQRPQKNFPKALLLAFIFILVTLGGGALVIALVLPAGEIDLVSGIMQVFASIFQTFGIGEWAPLFTSLIAVGSIGTMINWIISPAKGLQEAGAEGFLPPLLARQNKHGVATHLLLLQAAFVSLFSIFFLLEPNLNSYFWFLTALSTELYMLMYLLMFGSALVLRYRNSSSGAFQVPGGMYGLSLICGLGILGSLTTLVVSFFPPAHVSQALHYLLKIVLGNIVTLSPILLFYLYFHKRRKRIPLKD